MPSEGKGHTNDLIWNYWVNNYLFGNSPPAFDILFWNADTTCLPARLHHDYIDLYFTNPFVNANKLTFMKRVQADSYVVAGVTDHITHWKAVYQTAKIYGDDTTFVLSNSGHLQAMLNPPTNPKSSFVTGLAKASIADEFLAGAEKKRGSWWPLAQLACRALRRGNSGARNVGMASTDRPLITILEKKGGDRERPRTAFRQGGRLCPNALIETSESMRSTFGFTTGS